MLARDIIPDVPDRPDLGHDLRQGYIPAGYRWMRPRPCAEADPKTYDEKVLDSMVVHVETMLKMQERGAITFDYGNNLRGQVADLRGMSQAFDFPGFVPAYIRPLFCRGAGPFRWAALSGQSGRYRRHRPGHTRTVPGKGALRSAGSTRRRKRSSSRACRRASAGWNTASVPKPAKNSTGWSRKARSRPRS
jgi:urocanate hydratase